MVLSILMTTLAAPLRLHRGKRKSPKIQEKKKPEYAPVGRQKKAQSHSALKKLQETDRRWHLSSYRIRRGDNLWKIAEKFDISHRLIMKFNDLSKPDLLKPGSEILVPNRSGVYHSVRRGDTLSMIAKRYRGEVEAIRKQNRLRGSRILRGNKLFIPDGRIPSAGQWRRKRLPSEENISSGQKLTKVA